MRIPCQMVVQPNLALRFIPFLQMIDLKKKEKAGSESLITPHPSVVMAMQSTVNIVFSQVGGGDGCWINRY